jgi:hypothetical protein
MVSMPFSRPSPLAQPHHPTNLARAVADEVIE